MTRPVYMDHHSTTPLEPRVLEAMMPWLTERFGNAASRSHAFGWEAEEAVERAREQVAALIGGSAREVVWTSGATESDNLAIKGVADATPGHVITTRIEHKAVLDTCKRLERGGAEVTYLDVDADGRVSAEAVAGAIREDTTLISVMWVNNEVGAVQPIAEIGQVAKARGVLFHCDAVQGLATLPFDVDAMGVDLVSLSAHKMYGPKGVGALWVRRRGPRVRLVGQIDGGGHERGMRSGTLNVPAIVGMGEAARIAMEERDANAAHARALRDRLWATLSGALDAQLNGPPLDAGRHPGNLNVSFPFVEAEALMLALKETVAVSSGSACTSASLEPSYVLRAMGVEEERAHASLRFGLGRINTEAEVDAVAERVIAEVRRLRALNPAYRLAERGVEVDW
ncbi:MAG: IscS subfamily cysteine desulfurase [Myxococcota bacterium]|nr:IscS subfamily cysteine desulfurase [Myxococcota bacterium]